jgi:hypothetical protein
VLASEALSVTEAAERLHSGFSAIRGLGRTSVHPPQAGMRACAAPDLRNILAADASGRPAPASFVMMGSGVRIPLAHHKIKDLAKLLQSLVLP